MNFDNKQPCERFANMYAVRGNYIYIYIITFHYVDLITFIGDRLVTDKTAAIHQCIAIVKLASKGTNGSSHHLLR